MKVNEVVEPLIVKSIERDGRCVKVRMYCEFGRATKHIYEVMKVQQYVPDAPPVVRYGDKVKIFKGDVRLFCLDVVKTIESKDSLEVVARGIDDGGQK